MSGCTLNPHLAAALIQLDSMNSGMGLRPMAPWTSDDTDIKEYGTLTMSVPQSTQ